MIQVASSPFLLMAAVGFQVQDADRVRRRGEGEPRASSPTARPGNGTFTHLVVELLQKAGNFKVVQVPYKGAAPAITDLLGGHIPMAALSIASGMPHIQGGKVRGLAVTVAQRAARRCPTSRRWPNRASQDFEANGWLGILVPNGTPPAVIARLNAEIAKVMQSAGDEEGAARAGRRGADQHARGIRRDDQEREREVGQDHRRRGHQGVGKPYAKARRTRA